MMCIFNIVDVESGKSPSIVPLISTGLNAPDMKSAPSQTSGLPLTAALSCHTGSHFAGAEPSVACSTPVQRYAPRDFEVHSCRCHS
jgi:hypothetical protein